ncbi:MAG: RNA polymerase sigma factor [Vicinamibacterales bacterium]
MPGEDHEPVTDAELAQRAASGDREAFGILVTRHQASVLRLAQVITRSHDEAEDVLQQTFLAAWRGIRGFRAEASVRTWVLTIARHAALAQRGDVARQRTDPTPLDALGLRAGWGGPSPEQQMLESERAMLLATAFARLSAEDREIVTVRDFEGIPGEEAARLLGLSVPAMKSRLHRARLALAAAVREEVSHASR